mmetsp:Transcript_37964/g.93314  ORF Transcript_37964/g.93314 Transcript_37964/m.93314 type:complete len:86 (+) Transcript_37964:358-615(+)
MAALSLARQALTVASWGFAVGFLMERNSNKLPLIPKAAGWAPTYGDAASAQTSTVVRFTGLGTNRNGAGARPTNVVTVYDGRETE